MSLTDNDRAYLAGKRAGMLEAANICEKKVQRDSEYGGRWGGYGRFMGDMTGPECAAAIRAEAEQYVDFEQMATTVQEEER
jgi:hypothetical protein